MKKRKHKAQLGTVIHGTLQPLELIDAFADELARFRLPREVRMCVNTIAKQLDREDECIHDHVWQEDTLEWLTNRLDERSLPYSYFGTNQGDGSDFGWWPVDLDDLDPDDVMKVGDTSDVPKGYTGTVMYVNDHGNVTLYQYSRGRAREIWSIV